MDCDIPGKIKVEKTFMWGDERWHVPSVYVCDEGIVIDFCVERPPRLFKEYVNKWDIFHARRDDFTREQLAQIENENPDNIEFDAEVRANGEGLCYRNDCERRQCRVLQQACQSAFLEACSGREHHLCYRRSVVGKVYLE